jgi:nucleoside-diphosphate-sugar epimerase
MRFLVTGASGFIGSHVVELLLASGLEVVCPVRNPSALGHLEGIRAEVVSLESIEDVAESGAGFDYVIHLAGATRAPDYESYRRANVDWTRRLLQAFCSPNLKVPLKRFLLVSSQAASGPSPPDGTPARESDPPRPVSPYGRSKLEAEEATMSFGESIPVTIVRPPTVFGPRDADVLGVFRSAQFRLAPCLAGPDRLVSMIYVEDLAEGILRAALSHAARGQIYFLANVAPVIWREFALEVARILGYRAVCFPIPLALAKAMALTGDLISKVSNAKPVFRSEKFEEMKQIAWVCSTEKALTELNWQPCTPLEKAVKTTAAWYRKRGWM